jgi:eukaryotic translation initiation factor 2C
MERPVILYSNTSDHKLPDDENAKWNLRGKLQFLESPCRAQALNYYMFIDPSIRANNTLRIYQDAINEQARKYGVASRASCLGSHILPSFSQPDLTHDKLVDGFSRTITTLLKQKPGGTLAILLLAKHNIPVYSAFKDCTDRYLGLQALCMTEAKNLQGGSCKVNVAPYVANVIMKVNLKTGGRNHTAAGKGGNGRIEDTLKDTLLLGADVTHPGPGSLTGCPSIAVIVGSVDGSGGKFLGSMRLQHRSKTEVSLQESFHHIGALLIFSR